MCDDLHDLDIPGLPLLVWRLTFGLVRGA